MDSTFWHRVTDNGSRLICSSLWQCADRDVGDREIHGRQSRRIANILATNPGEAKTTREGAPSISRSIDLPRSKCTRCAWQNGRPWTARYFNGLRENLSGAGYEFRCATPRFNVIRRFLCKRVFRYSDRPTRLDANGDRTTVIPRDTRRSGTYPRDNVDFLAAERFIPHTCARGKAVQCKSANTYAEYGRTCVKQWLLFRWKCHEKKARRPTDTSGTLDFRAQRDKPRGISFYSPVGIFFRNRRR